MNDSTETIELSSDTPAELEPEAQPLTVESVKALQVQSGVPETSLEAIVGTLNQYGAPIEAAEGLLKAVPKAPEPEPLKMEDFVGEVKPQERFIELANTLKLNKDQAERLIDFSNKLTAERQEAALKSSQDAWNAQQQQWKSELEKDSELTAGDGLDQNIKSILRVVADYGGEVGEDGNNEVQRAINEVGLGNHPSLCRFLLRLSKALPGEGNLVTGTNSRSKSESDSWASLFPNT